MKVTSEAVFFGALINWQQPITQALDIGCGTGLLSLMLAQRHAELSIDALDVSLDALIDAGLNITSSPWADRLQLYHNDVKDYAIYCHKQYDLIVCNPPFYRQHKLSESNTKNSAWHLPDTLTPEIFAAVCKTLLSNTGEAWFIWPTHEAGLFIESCKQLGLSVTNRWLLRHSQQKPSKRQIISISNRVIKDSAPMNLIIYNSANEFSPLLREKLQPFYRFLE